MILYFLSDECWFCHTRGPMSEHHLIRRSRGGKEGLAIALCEKCHRKATNDINFEIHLQRLYETNRTLCEY